MKYLFAILVAAALVVAAYFGQPYLGKLISPKWNPNVTYVVWISEAKVSPMSPSGRPWHDDGTAPNLVASLSWKDNLLLETPSAPSTLNAKWRNTSVAPDVGTQNGTSETEMVARIHADSNDLMEIQVRDQGMISSQWIGGFTIPCGKLKPGLNVIEPRSSINTLSLEVVPAGVIERSEPLPRWSNTISVGIVPLPSPSAGGSDFNSSTTGKALRKGVKAARDFIEKNFKGN
jgi:hypothetical protein